MQSRLTQRPLSYPWTGTDSLSSTWHRYISTELMCSCIVSSFPWKFARPCTAGSLWTPPAVRVQDSTAGWGTQVSGLHTLAPDGVPSGANGWCFLGKHREWPDGTDLVVPDTWRRGSHWGATGCAAAASDVLQSIHQEMQGLPNCAVLCRIIHRPAAVAPQSEGFTATAQ